MSSAPPSPANAQEPAPRSALTFKRTYLATYAPLAGVALAGTSVITAVTMVTAHEKNGAPDTLLMGQAPTALLFVLVLCCFVQLAHCRVRITSAALIIAHPVRRYVFPWEQVADVIVEEDGQMRTLLQGGGSFAVVCFQGSNLGRITGGIHAKRARDGIKAAMAEAAVQDPPRSVSSSVEIHWVTMLGILTGAEVLAVVGWLQAAHHVLVLHGSRHQRR